MRPENGGQRTKRHAAERFFRSAAFYLIFSFFHLFFAGYIIK